jgi:hypothetical protein
MVTLSLGSNGEFSISAAGTFPTAADGAVRTVIIKLVVSLVVLVN